MATTAYHKPRPDTYAALVIERPMADPRVVAEDLDDDVCLYRADIDEVVVLNRSAGDVWRLADGERRVDEIVDMLATAYQSAAVALREDVVAVIDDLSRRGYLLAGGQQSRT